MRWHRKKVRAINQTRSTLLGGVVRIADNGLTRVVGLLGERGLPEGDGLLIVPSQGVHTVGMLFPIDVVFLDNDWRVIALRRAVRPFRITRIYWKAAAVLELPAGTVNATGTEVGDQIEFQKAGKIHE